ncbi:MAG: hypothetical protein ACKOA1_08130, partial [Bacteroidota bacterium]
MSYLLAQKNGNAWINYEPYFWLNRKTSIINYEGMYHHSSSPHIAENPDKFTKRHRNFLKDLSNHKGDIVTKFIRGNGRINAISQILEPDITLVIIRDLYQVLTSVLRTNWDFLSVGFEYKLNWENFIKEVRASGLIDDFNWFNDRVNDRLDRNAFYWYVMNLSALSRSTDELLFIDYKDIQKTEEIAQRLVKAEQTPPISDPIFSGDYIHSDFPLTSDYQRFSTRELLNGLFYKSQLTDKYGIYFASKRVGDRVHINDEYKVIESPEPKPTKLSIEKKDLYE